MVVAIHAPTMHCTLGYVCIKRCGTAVQGSERTVRTRWCRSGSASKLVYPREQFTELIVPY